MSREIKFRAWNIKENRWCAYHEIDQKLIFNAHYPSGSGVIEINEHTGTGVAYDLGHSVELVQYTGLKDRNGEEIYEGDIVKGEHRAHEHVMNQEVKMFKGCFMFGNWNAHEYFNKHTHIEVIGNIYEHPHLLEAE